MNAGVASWIVRAALGGGLVCSALSGCGDDQDATGAPRARQRALSEPIAIGRALAFLDRERDSVWWVRLPSRAAESGELEAVSTAVPANPLVAAPRSADHAELLVRTAGLRGVGDRPRLVAVDAEGDRREYALNEPYSELEVSEDGRYALASFARGAVSARTFAPSQLAVVDLDAKESRAVSELALALEGDAPSRVWLAPPLQQDGRTWQLALASFPRALALLDLAQPEAGALELTLTGDAQLSLELEQVLYVPDAGRIVLRFLGLDDVFVADLHDDPDSERGVRVSLDQFPAGETPLHVVAPSASSLLVLTHDGRELRAIDTEGRSIRVQSLESPSSELLHCASGCRYALGHGPGSADLNLIDLERSNDSEPADLDLARPLAGSGDVARTVLDEAHRRGIVVHEGGAITLVDLEHGTLSPLAVQADLAELLQLAPDGALWFARPGDLLVTRVDPESGHATEVLLDHPLEQLVFVPDLDRVVAVHVEPELALSVLDARAPRSVEARRVRGVD